MGYLKGRITGFINAITVPASDGFENDRIAKYLVLSNVAMDPTPPDERTWTWWHYTALWWGYGFSIELWAIGASSISVGLTWYEALICIFISHLLGAIGIVLNGHIGAVYHIGFPVAQRNSYGILGGFFPVLLRSAVGIIWVGVQIYQGGRFVQLILRCIFGHHFTDVKNTIPASAGITVQSLIGVIVFWIITLPLLNLPIHKTRHIWTLKAFVMPFTVFGLFIFTQLANHGKSSGHFDGTGNLRGSALGWMMLSIVNATMGKTSTSTVNQPDLTRYAKTTLSPLWSQLLMLPFANTAVACLGIFGTSSIRDAWGVTYWNIWDLSTAILDRHWSGGVRFAIFLTSCSFVLSIFATNQAINVIPFGADMVCIAPRWLTIQRAEVLSYCIGLLIQPWYILASATTFLTFLGGYSVFLGPILGVNVADFYWRRGNLDVHDMYSASKTGVYWYTGGFNWRAGISFLAGCMPTIPGFVGTFGHKVPIGAVHLYEVGWLFSTICSALVYIALSILFPPSGLKAARAAPFEQWAIDQKAKLDRVRTAEEFEDSDSARKDEKLSA